MDVNTQCPSCAAPRPSIVRDGFFYRADDSQFIQRLKCKVCAKKFSAATSKATYRQKKRRINPIVRRSFASNMCPRDIAELVGVNVKTVFARLRWQAVLSREKNRRFLREYIDQYGPIKTVQFDDLLTFEHTKCKPLSIPVAVIDGVRVPIGFRVASMRAFAHLAVISRKRYGRREDQSRRERQALFASSRGAVVGQGELKKIAFDPLFSVNHTFATVRAKVNRLNRRTWCTTKKPDRLADHLDIFIDVFCDRLKLLKLSPDAQQRQAGKVVIKT